MRLVALAILLSLLGLSGAEARNCVMPPASLKQSTEQFGAYNTLACALAEINDLKAEQAQLRAEVNRLKRAVRELPGEFRNEDGKISKPDGGKIGSATFLLTARSGLGSASLPIEQSLLAELCSGGGGCSVTVLYEAEGIRLGETTETIAVGPCSLSYNPTSGSWARGDGCGEAGVPTGIDGNGSPVSGGGGETIAAAGGACVLADADAGRSVGGSGEFLGGDSARGFHLIAAPALREKTGGRFRCELKIE